MTRPNGKTPAAASAADFNLGNEDGTIFTIPWPDGTVVFEPGGPGFVLPDGSLAMKWPWYRTVPGNVIIEGRRLDGPALPMPRITLRGAEDGYGDTGFQPSGLTFPSEGCWEVIASVADHSLTFVTLVVRARDLPVPTPRPPDLYIQSELARYDLFPIPTSCKTYPTSQREMRRGFTAWWWLGEGLDAGTDVGVLFEGENEIQWQYYREADLSIVGEHLAYDSLRLEVLSERPLELREYLGQVVNTTLLFPAPGCWQLHAHAGLQILDATLYVYPWHCRPSHLRDNEQASSTQEPCIGP